MGFGDLQIDCHPLLSGPVRLLIWRLFAVWLSMQASAGMLAIPSSITIGKKFWLIEDLVYS